MGKTKRWLTCFEEIKKMGEGGNADVYLVKEKMSENQYALKELRNRTEEKKARFVSEIQIAKEKCSSIPGIIPIFSEDSVNYWYTMPVAQPVMEFIDEKNLEEIVKGVIQLCETLEQLHDKKIYHRDIKPSNIYYYNNRFSLGDFGLVDFPDNDDFTKSDQGLGAIFTIAPEMKRNPKMADASKADVYSLAKTFWMFLSGDEKGFDGVYNYLDESHSLRYISKFKKEHLVEIDELLKDSTNNNPDLRPDIHIFKERLIAWTKIFNDFNRSQNSDWLFLTQQLFGKNVPDSSTWRKIDEIVNVLNIIGKTPAYNHMPEGFGQLYECCIGEYPWSPAMVNYLGQEEEQDFRQENPAPCYLITTANDYIAEKDSPFCSNEDSSYMFPSKYLMEQMNLMWNSSFGYTANGSTVIINGQNNTLYIKKKFLLDFIEQNKLDIVWTVLGEKQKITGGFDGGFPGRSEFSYTYYINEKDELSRNHKVYNVRKARSDW